MSEPTVWEMNRFGQYEGYDEEGKLVCVQKPKGNLKKAIEKGTKAPLSAKKELTGKKRKNRSEVPYSRKKAEEIFDLLISGVTVTKMCMRKDMPAKGTFYKWQAKYPQFKAMMEEAKKLRADAMYDEALDEARSLDDPGMARIAKVKIDTLKWAAGVGNPNEYNPRPKEENRGNIFVIHTGIDRGEQEKTIELKPERKEITHEED